MRGFVTVVRLLNAAEVPADVLAFSQSREGFQEEYPFESHWADIDGRIMHYVDEGSGPVLLMVHGNPTWSFAWRNLIKHFSGRYRVIAVDHLGCGFSQKPGDGDYQLADHIARLRKLVAILDLQQVTLFAHDWGGAIGMGTAGQLPDVFKAFVLMNTGAFRSQNIPFRISLCRIPVLGTLGMQGFNLFSLAAVRMAVEKRLPASVAAGFLAPYNSWNHRRAVREFVHDIPLSASHPSYQPLVQVEEGLAQFIDHPMLLPWGMKDWCFTPEFYDEFCHRFPQAQRHPIADAGHYIFEDATEELIQTSDQFLTKVYRDEGVSAS